jgi:uncharacterized protein (DUF58 family)
MSTISRLLDPELVERLRGLALSARRVVRGSVAGLHRSPVRGASVEFRQHRAYSPGDELRRLDWRVLGRTDRTFVREYDEETNLRSVMLLDVSGSMAYGRRAGKMDFARRLVAAIGYLMLSRTESVGLATFSDRLRGYLRPHSGTTQLATLLEALERIEPAGASDPETSAAQLADRLDRRALVILFSDLLCPTERFARTLARLRHERHELIVVRVLHRDEIEFPFRQWTRFAGMEGEPPALLEPSATRAYYRQAFSEHETRLIEIARQADVALLPAVSDDDLFDVVLSVVRRRPATLMERPR